MRRKKFALFFLFLMLLTSFSFLLSANVYEGATDEGVEDYYRGRVVSVVNIDQDSDFVVFEQNAEVLLLRGPYEGQIVEINNLFISDTIYTNIYLEEGTEIIVVAYNQGGQVNFYLQDIARDRGLLYLTIAFVILILLVGMMQGAKTLLTLVITAFVIFRGMLPLLLA